MELQKSTQTSITKIRQKGFLESLEHLPIKSSMTSVEVSRVKSMQLSVLKKGAGSQQLIAEIGISLMKIGNLFGLTLTDYQVGELSRIIMDEYWMMTMAEIKWIMEGIKTQKWEKLYGAALVPYIIQVFHVASGEVMEARTDIGYQEHFSSKEKEDVRIGVSTADVAFRKFKNERIKNEFTKKL